MKQKTVRFYQTDELANEALANYIKKCPVSEARNVEFSNDDWLYHFEYIDMEEQEWYGWMCGIKVTNTAGDEIIFASWNDPDDEHDKSQDEYERVFSMFIRSLVFN